MTSNWPIMSWSSWIRLWQWIMYLPRPSNLVMTRTFSFSPTIDHVLRPELVRQRWLAVAVEDLEVDEVDVHRVEPATRRVLQLPDLDVTAMRAWPA